MDKTTDESMQSRLSIAMEFSGLTQSELAERIGTSKAAVSQWVSGKKKPGDENLKQLAEILGITPEWLEYGVGTPPQPDSLKEREKYLNLIDWTFRKVPLDGGKDFGNSNVWSLPWDISTLVREAGQNSIDAAIDPNNGIEMEFRLTRLEGKELDNFLSALKWEPDGSVPGLFDHIDKCASNQQKLGRIFREGIELLKQDRELLLLRIDDKRTRGLLGPEFADGNFTALCRDNLNSQKDKNNAGGAYGLGKAVFWRASRFATVLFNSNLSEPVADGEEEHQLNRLIGKADLMWHETEAGGFAGPGWLGETEKVDGGVRPKSVWNNKALARDLFLDRNDGDTGTSILVLGFHDAASDAPQAMPALANDIAQAVAHNFWPALVSGKLSVTVTTREGNREKSKTVVDPDSLQKPFADMLRKFRDGMVTDQLKEGGDVVQKRIFLSIPRRKIDPKHLALEHEAILLVRRCTEAEADASCDQIAFYRGREMVVKFLSAKNLSTGGVPFHAAVLCGEAAGNSDSDRAAEWFLRTAEPPAHNDWTSTPELRTDYYPGGKKSLDQFFESVKDEIRKLIRPQFEDLEDGPSALKELLRIPGDPPPPPPGMPRLVVGPNSGVDEQGRWNIQASIRIPDDKTWVIKPVLIFHAESGGGRPVAWTLQAQSGCTVDNDQLLIPKGTREARFRGTSVLESHPVRADKSAVRVVIRKARSLEGGQE